MAHIPEEPKRFVCENCQIIHAGTPVHASGGDHSFETPTTCGGCGESTFVEFTDWVHHHA
ncbi:hypothetical protein [Halosimplex amylolyticum]|uniref:hypothetical protein n=1 Tax=Halosimplex amylolyticum TaxID=3396616 RepID=UPI003F54E927